MWTGELEVTSCFDVASMNLMNVGPALRPIISALKDKYRLVSKNISMRVGFQNLFAAN